MRMRTITALVVLTAVLATGCGAGATDAPSDPTSSTETTGGSNDQTTPAGDQPSASRPGSGNSRAHPTFAINRTVTKNRGAWDLVLRDVTVTGHEEFDRVVVEFAGTGTPGWASRYVATPRADGSGEVVALDGDNVLMVDISGVTIRAGHPATAADFFDGDHHFAPSPGQTIQDVNILGAFEGYSRLFLGIRGQREPFRVFTGANPTRLVVDVRHEPTP